MILPLKSVSIQSRAILLKHHSTPQLTKLMWTQIQTSIGSEVQSRMRKYFFLVAFYIWKGHKRRSWCITRPKDILMTWLRSLWRGFYNIFNGRKLQDMLHLYQVLINRKKVVLWEAAYRRIKYQEHSIRIQ